MDIPRRIPDKPIDSTSMDRHIPKMEEGESFKIDGTLVTVVKAEPKGMMLRKSWDVQGVFPEFGVGKVFRMKSFYWRVVFENTSAVTVVPHGRTMYGVILDEKPTRFVVRDMSRAEFRALKRKQA